MATHLVGIKQTAEPCGTAACFLSWREELEEQHLPKRIAGRVLVAVALVSIIAVGIGVVTFAVVVTLGVGIAVVTVATTVVGLQRRFKRGLRFRVRLLFLVAHGESEFFRRSLAVAVIIRRFGNVLHFIAFFIQR